MFVEKENSLITAELLLFLVILTTRLFRV